MRSILLFCLLFPLTLTAQASLFDLFPAGDSPTQSSLSYESSPTDTFLVFRFVGIDSAEHAFQLKTEERGRFRRRFCAHAPLKLDFKKGELRSAGLADYDKYKLVLPCQDGRLSERLVLKEFLAYRAYRLFAPQGYRVRLLRLKIDDQEEKTAFLIENNRELANRLMAGHAYGGFGTMAMDYDPTEEAVNALFAYLIGNTDWDPLVSRNLRSLPTADGKLLPVAYDFDFSSWVNAEYARPRSDLGQRQLTDRVYLGLGHPEAVLYAATQRFHDRRQHLIALINEARLPNYERRRLKRLVAGFFQELPRLISDIQIEGGTAGAM